MRFAALVMTATAACAHAQQIEAPAPRLIVHANDAFEGYPIAAGTPITVQADWAGTCREHRTGIMAVFAAKLGSTYDVPCDEQPFTIQIDCGYPCRIDSDKHDPPIEGHMRIANFEGDRKFFITPLAEHARIFVSLQHGSTSHTYDSPELHVLVPTEFVIECRVQSTPVLCDEPLPAGEDPEIRVRSATALPLGSVKINGRADPGWIRIANLYQQRASGGTSPPSRGDYPVVVEVNPYPHTIRREVTIRVR